eukprot:CAMPEP_0184485720 /NCGR_PEP_ID=MMETSP0113_2-20130426/7302_1 /TAXON_ID=91329 /ORGANISM="Norrisiella sphaerica, Strain BC52" /LENGTH=42 /DNA_ID= /DNA_START= /DNA_END= /DNA_ORIENTATION=
MTRYGGASPKLVVLLSTTVAATAITDAMALKGPGDLEFVLTA